MLILLYSKKYREIKNFTIMNIKVLGLKKSFKSFMRDTKIVVSSSVKITERSKVFETISDIL